MKKEKFLYHQPLPEIVGRDTTIGSLVYMYGGVCKVVNKQKTMAQVKELKNGKIHSFYIQ